jgi:hypothetical protein
VNACGVGRKRDVEPVVHHDATLSLSCCVDCIACESHQRPVVEPWFANLDQIHAGQRGVANKRQECFRWSAAGDEADDWWLHSHTVNF